MRGMRESKKISSVNLLTNMSNEERTYEKALCATQGPYGMGRFSQVFARWGDATHRTRQTSKVHRSRLVDALGMVEDSCMRNRWGMQGYLWYPTRDVQSLHVAPLDSQPILYDEHAERMGLN